MSFHIFKYFVTQVSCFKAFSKWGNWGKLKMRWLVHIQLVILGSQATAGTTSFLLKKPRVLPWRSVTIFIKLKLSGKACTCWGYYPRKVHVLNWVMGEVGRVWGLGLPFNYSSKAQGSCITPKDTSREEQIYERFRITWVEIYDDDWIILSLKTKIFPNLLFATAYYWAYEQTWNMLERKLTSFVIDLIICLTLQSATVCKITVFIS